MFEPYPSEQLSFSLITILKPDLNYFLQEILTVWFQKFLFIIFIFYHTANSIFVIMDLPQLFEPQSEKSSL